MQSGGSNKQKKIKSLIKKDYYAMQLLSVQD